MNQPKAIVAAASDPMTVAGCAIHPCYILRVAGEPVDALAAIGTGEADRAWREATTLRAQIAAESPARCAALEAQVPLLGDKNAMHAALAVKRAIYGGKAFAPALLGTLAGRIEATESEALEALNASLRRLASLEAEIHQAHEREMVHGSAALPELLNGRNMLSALSYTNPEFLQKLDRHLVADGRKTNAKSLRNIEDSLLQYHARSSTKTSPLSSFTVIGVGEWQKGAAADWSVDYPAGLERRVELKAGLIRHIMAPLLQDFAIAARAFPFSLNRSIRNADGRIRLNGIAPGQEISGRTWGTGLTLAQLDGNAMLGLIEHIFAANGGSPMTVPALCAELSRRAPKLTAEAILPFLARLFSMQYLLPETGLVEQSDILDWAQALSTNPALPRGPEIGALLEEIAAALQTMRGDDPKARAAAVLGVRRLVLALAEITGADTESPHFKPAFYENCYLKAGDTELNPGHLAEFEEELELLHELSLLLDPNQELHARMADFFVGRHGESGLCEDVTAFLEAFDSVYAPGVLDKQIEAGQTAANSPRTEAWLRAKRAFDASVEPFLDGAGDIELDFEAMRGVLSLIPPHQRSRSASYSYVVQTARENGEERLVLNQVFGGRSSILSRFLEVAGEDQVEKVRDYLKSGSPTGRPVELGGVFGFNANRHPALSTEELEVAPFPPSFADTAKLQLRNVRLKYDADAHRLQFLAPDGDPIDVFYQGLLIPSLLPQLHRVLSLGFTEGPSFAITKALTMRSMGAGRTSSYVPRMSLGKIVLLRRTWLIAAAEAPDATLLASEFWVAARHWQERFALPDRFFIRAVPLFEAPSAENERPSIDWEGVNFKDMKPFFVDLRSPRFVRLMQNMMKRNSLALCITELLPDFGDHPTTIEGRRHVAELHFELSRAGREPAASDLKWFTVRIAYFDEDRRPLMENGIEEAVATARAAGARRVYIAPHWKFGPHVDVNIEIDADVFLLDLFPALQRKLGAWLADHPSLTVIDPEAHLELSRRVGMFELDEGPYLPLLRNNSVSAVAYARAKTLVIPEFADSREQLLSDSLDLVMELYRLKATDPNGVFLALQAMLAATADTYESGMRDGYMSLRSHADYFFAAHDVRGAVRGRFDSIEAKRRDDIDRVTQAIADDSIADLPIAEPLRDCVSRWIAIIRATNVRNGSIVEANHAALTEQTLHMDLALRMAGDAPEDLQAGLGDRKISEIGDIFLNTDQGIASQKTKAFITFRTNVNFFYAILPILEVPPMQKFLLCHLIANSVERVFDENWRAKIQLVAAE